MESIEKKLRVCDRIHSKYGFGDLEVGDVKCITADFVKVRCAAYGFGKKWGAIFLVTERSGGRVEIKRYK
jgi:hypothetical protein